MFKSFFSNKTKIIYLIIVIVCLGAVPFAEYRRVVMGILDVYYWIALSPITVAVFFLYQLIGVPKIEKEKALQDKQRAQGQSVDSYKLFTMKCNALSMCFFIIAIVCFASSGVIYLFQ